MSNTHKKKEFFSPVSILAILFLLCSCVSTKPTTGTTVKFDHNKKENIKKLGIVVEGAENFDVRSARGEVGASDITASALTGMLGLVTTPVGLVWGAALQSKRINRDKEASSSIETLITEYKIADDFQRTIYNYATDASLFEQIIKIKGNENNEKPNENIDAILQVNIISWGLRRVSEGNKENYKKKLLQAELRINAKIVLNNDEVLWSLDDHYISGKQYLIKDIQDKPSMIIEMFTGAVSDISKKIVNKILYS